MKNKLNLLIVALFLLTQTTLAQTWTQIGQDIDGEAAKNESGNSVSMPDANTVAIGAYKNDGNGQDAGHVRIYSWNDTSWIQKGDDIVGTIDGTEDGWQFLGYSVSMPDSNTVAIGVILGGGDINTEAPGFVEIYSWSGTAWVQKGDDIDGKIDNESSGWAVSMPDANTVAIGAPSGSGNQSGHVRIYSWSDTSWIQKGDDIVGEARDGLGVSVSMPDANTIALGAPLNDGNAINAGTVRIYYWSGTAWVQKGSDIDGEAESDESGISVSMPDANTVAIGAYRNDGNGQDAGHVRIYTWSGLAWVQKGSDIDGEASGDESGWVVSMPDANTVAIGAYKNDGNGQDAGHVRIYTWSGLAWVQNGSDIDGEAMGDASGYSVSMPDSNTIVLGAPWNDGNGNLAGHTRVYKLETGANTETIEAHKIYISPNPVSDILTVNGISQPVEFQITDLTGKEILSGEISNNSVDVSSLKVGLYLLKLENRSIQFIKE